MSPTVTASTLPRRSRTAPARLVGVLAWRGLRRNLAASLLLLATIATATTMLSLALALASVSDIPWNQTRDMTRGPDVWVRADRADQLSEVLARPGVLQAGPVLPLYGVTDLDGGRGSVTALVQERDTSEASVDRPALITGTWARPGGIVVERAFAEALDVGPGDTLQISGRPLTVTGTAVTTARSPYPMNTPGMVWISSADGAWVERSASSRSVSVALTLDDPATAPSFAAHVSAGEDMKAQPWQLTRSYTVSDQERVGQVLMPGAWILALLGVAAAAVLTGSRMAAQHRRVGLLKAVGASPRLVTLVLLAEHLAVALAAALVGLITGTVAARLLARPSPGMIDVDLEPTIGTWQAVQVVVVATLVVCAAAIPVARRAARDSTRSALVGDGRAPRRSAGLISLSARLPVPGLIGLRLAARRPQRTALASLSLTLAAAMVVAALSIRHQADSNGLRAPSGVDFVPGAGNPVMERVDTATAAVMTALLTLAVLNTLLIGWATVIDFLRGTALLRALGTTTSQLAAGITAANLIPAVLGGILAVPVGLAVFRAGSRLAGVEQALTTPPLWWLACVPAGTLAVVSALMVWPARTGARRSVSQILASESGR
jgi:putative ABC transport system permease protein